VEAVAAAPLEDAGVDVRLVAEVALQKGLGAEEPAAIDVVVVDVDEADERRRVDAVVDVVLEAEVVQLHRVRADVEHDAAAGAVGDPLDGRGHVVRAAQLHAARAVRAGGDGEARDGVRPRGEHDHPAVDGGVVDGVLNGGGVVGDAVADRVVRSVRDVEEKGGHACSP